MTRRMMRLGLSIASAGYHYAAWCHPDVDVMSATSIQHHVKAAQLAERGKMDFVFLADWSSILNVDDLRIARDREQAQVKVDPTLAMAAVAVKTKHVGLMPTASTTYWHPFNFARRMATIDFLSGGRVGWNMVTSHGLDEARNFGLDKPLDSDTRHERAREFIEVMRGLWDSWDDDAFIRDKASGHFFHREKVHFLNHAGTHFKVRGPLDMARPPQGFLPIITAGTSENSQDLAAEIADMCYGGQPNIEAARAYYASVKGRLPKYGRRPEDLLMLPGIQCYVGRTQSEAEDKFALMQRAMPKEVGIGQLIVNHFPDLSAYGLDDPLPDLTMRNEFLGSEKLGGREPELTLALMRRARDEKLTLRQLFDVALCGFWSLGVIGTPATIADMMEEWFTTGAADGFNVQPPYLPGGGEDFVDLVIPELQQRGLFRTEYGGRTLRENLGLPRPPSRYASTVAEAAE